MIGKNDLFKKNGRIIFSLVLLFSFFFTSSPLSALIILSNFVIEDYRIIQSEKTDLSLNAMPQQYFEIQKDGKSIYKLQGMNIKSQRFNSDPPFIVTSTYTGGAHCCSNLAIFNFGYDLKKITLPAPFNNEEFEAHQFFSWKQDPDGKDKLTITTQDPHWHYWRTYYADSAAPAVYWGFDGDKLSLNVDLLKENLPDKSEILKRANEIQENKEYWQEFIQKAAELKKQTKEISVDTPASQENVSLTAPIKGIETGTAVMTLEPEIPYPGSITGMALTLLYGGKPESAREFIDQAWNSSYPYKEDFIRDLNQELDKSLYWKVLQGLGYKKIPQGS